MAGFFKKVRFDKGKVLEEEAFPKESSGRRVPKGSIMVDGEVVALKDSKDVDDNLKPGSFKDGDSRETVDVKEESKSIGYHAITNDPYEMCVDEIVSGLVEKYGNSGDYGFIEKSEKNELRQSAELSDVYDYACVMRDDLNALIINYCNGISYHNYKNEYRNGSRTSYNRNGHMEMLRSSYHVERSELLEESLVNKGIVRDKDTEYVFCDVIYVLDKIMKIETEMSESIKKMNEIIGDYHSKKILGAELEKIGRNYKIINNLNIYKDFENVNNDLLPVVKVVITETGVHLLWDIKMDGMSKVKVTSEGYVYFREGEKWVKLKNSDTINRRMSYLLGNVTSSIRKKLGKNVKVNAVGFVSNSVDHIDNLSNRKVITLANLYDTVYADVDGILLSDGDMEDVFNLLESINTVEDLVDFVDISNELKTWENNLKVCRKLLSMRSLIRNVKRNGGN